ncbi:cytosine permease [Paracoccus sp. CPCC 101403]|uniref:Cytosine permease n=1 Tax=Paracoccus broussonetiae TaxID=3075834 RepID=A0ABU3EDU2_9RHOB|nr:cytosine permease [Paracoccus sp. CPCC 101403]MDT1062404.1 cytosine permease [Paracoccus sp. CPCC 101403]
MTLAGSIPPPEIIYHDEPEVLRHAAAEDFSLHIVPPTWRSSRFSLSMAWFGLMSAMFWVVVGSTVALTVGTVNTLIGIALSTVVYGILCNIAARFAARSGTSVALFSRAVFGQVGATFAALLFGITITYYAIAEGTIVAIALQDYFGGPMSLWYFIVCLYSAPLVMRGVRTWLDRINGILLPLYVLGLMACVIWAIASHGYSGDWLTNLPAGGVDVGVPGWWFAFTVYMGVWVVVMMTWDVARFGQKQDSAFNGNYTFGIPFYAVTLLINGAVGIFIAHTIPIEGALSETSAIIGIVALMGPFGVLLVWVSQTRINTINFYLSSTNMQNFFARAFKISWPRTVWVIIMTVVIFLVMLTNVFGYLLLTLQFQGVIIVAWVGVAMTHIGWCYLRGIRADMLEFRPGRVPLVNPGGLGAWVLASAVGCFLLVFGGSFGGIWAPPITLVIAVGIYAAALGVARRSWYVEDRPHDPRKEVDDPWSARIRCHHCHQAYIAHEMDRDPSAGHAPICLACASDRSEFLIAARAEARAGHAAAGQGGLVIE